MKRLFNLLKISISLLGILVCVSIVQKYFFNSTLSDNGKLRSIVSKSENVISNIDDILQTVASYDDSKAVDHKMNESVKSDYQLIEGKGKLSDGSLSNKNTDSTEQQNSDGSSVYFSESMYPYRVMLSNTEKNAYDQVYKAVISLKDRVTLSKQVSKTEIQNVMNAIFNDHPEFFWLESGYDYEYTSKGTVLAVGLKYNSTVDNMQTAKSSFYAAASEIVNGASQFGTDEEKAKYVYKCIQSKCQYDENSQMNQSAYSALVLGSSVCAGYSRAYQYIMQQLNIPCYFCTGYANGGNHAWNILYLNDKYVNADISWDDSLGDVTNTYSYTYFGLSDKAISADHSRRDMSKLLPSCE